VLLADRVLFTAAAIDGLTKAAQPGPETQEANAAAKAEKTQKAEKAEKAEEVAE
jgi:hypothetical protein